MSKLRVNELETLDGLVTLDVATLVDDFQTELTSATVTTSTGTQTIANALDDPERLSSNIVTPEDFGAAGDGVADDGVALKSALEDGRTVIGTRGAVYRITSVLSVASFALFISNDSSILLDFSPGVSTVAVSFPSGIKADKLVLDIPTGQVIDRAINLSQAGSKIDRLVITSVDQQNNRNANADAALGITGNDISLGIVEITNFDNGAHWSGDSGKLGSLSITSYVRGVWLDTPVGLEFGSITCATTSPNATGSPGHNGVLATGVTNLRGEEIRVEDSGEHGVRFSGNANNAVGIDIERILAINTGNSGVKFRCDDAFTIQDVNIGSIHCEDCGDAANPITNQEGLMLERVRRVWIGHYSLRKRNKTFSCHNGISVFDAQIVAIDSVKIENTNREAIYLESESNDDLGSPVFKDINDFRIGSGIVNTPGRHAIWLNLDTEQARAIHVDGPLHIRDLGSADAALLVGQLNGSQIVTDSFFNLHWTRIIPTSGNPVRGAGLNANVMLEITGNNSPLTTIAKIGSTWWNSSSGDRFIRDGTGTWVNII